MPSIASSPELCLAAAYGCRWSSQLPLHSFEPIPGSANRSLSEIEVLHHPAGTPPRELVRRGRHLWAAADGFRYLAEDGTAFDTIAGSRILISGPRSGAELPLPLYGTVTGLLLAWRGLIPIHGSAVEWNGNAVLFCGASGAGKSTTVAALISRGARLLSDDLSVLHSTAPGKALQLFAGRTTLRLFPAIAEALTARVPCGAAKPASPKLAVTPPRMDPWTAVPLRTLVLLGQPQSSTPSSLSAHLYRPQAMHAVPGQRRRLSTLAFATPALRILNLQPGPVQTRADFERAADLIVQTLDQASPEGPL